MYESISFSVLCNVKYAKSVFECLSVCACLALIIFSTYLDIPSSIKVIFIAFFGIYTDGKQLSKF